MKTKHELMAELHVAAAQDKVSRVRELLDAGIPRDAIDEYGNTLIRNVCQNNSLKVLRMLLASGCDPRMKTNYRSPVDGRTESGFVPLMYVTSVQAAELLCKYGADVNEADATGTTPLMRKARFADFELVKFLVENGADPALRQRKAGNRAGQNALEIAKEQAQFLPDDEGLASVIALLGSRTPV